MPDPNSPGGYVWGNTCNDGNCINTCVVQCSGLCLGCLGATGADGSGINGGCISTCTGGCISYCSGCLNSCIGGCLKTCYGACRVTCSQECGGSCRQTMISSTGNSPSEKKDLVTGYSETTLATQKGNEQIITPKPPSHQMGTMKKLEDNTNLKSVGNLVNPLRYRDLDKPQTGGGVLNNER